MQTSTAVSHPITALNLNLARLPDLLSETRTRIDAARQRKFDARAESLLNDCIEVVRSQAEGLDGGAEEAVGGTRGGLQRVAETLRSELERLGELLDAGVAHIDPEERERLEVQVAKAVDRCIETLRETVEGFSPEGARRVIHKWRKLHHEVETLSRRLELLRPPTRKALVATLWWVAERGDEADLDLLQKVRDEGLFGDAEVRGLIAAAEQRIGQRIFDPDQELQQFFGVGPEELARMLGAARAGKGPATRRAREAVEDLRAIRESLAGLFEREEIERWLRSPNEMFDGKTPIAAISEGQARRIRQLLVRIEDGISS